ncbi:hypothetical protein N665_0383s0233 [Sinapis alba]|nr:hypothetical protein N665_0383s0233 [Sinapis alba]
MAVPKALARFRDMTPPPHGGWMEGGGLSPPHGGVDGVRELVAASWRGGLEEGVHPHLMEGWMASGSSSPPRGRVDWKEFFPISWQGGWCGRIFVGTRGGGLGMDDTWLHGREYVGTEIHTVDLS